MALRKAQAAQRAGRSVFKLDAAQLLWLVISVVGMFPLVVLATLALIILLVIFAMAGGSQMTSQSSDPSDTGGQASDTNALIELSGGDGRGTFDPTNVPDQDLVAPIRAAAKKCDLLTPVIIAAQIEYASGFDADK
ncbi:chitinase, partial [Micromonospora sp. NPDC051296]